MLRTRLRAAAEEGLVLGVKWAIALAAILLGVSLTLGDYNLVRQRAYNGQLAFEALQRVQQQQAPAPAVPQSPPARSGGDPDDEARP
jgi:hypothetical protein